MIALIKKIFLGQQGLGLPMALILMALAVPLLGGGLSQGRERE